VGRFRALAGRRRVRRHLVRSAITPERERRFLYTRPYAVFDEAVVVARGRGRTGPDDLAGRRVGAIAGSTNLSLAETSPAPSASRSTASPDDVSATCCARSRRRGGRRGATTSPSSASTAPGPASVSPSRADRRTPGAARCGLGDEQLRRTLRRRHRGGRSRRGLCATGCRRALPALSATHGVRPRRRGSRGAGCGRTISRVERHVDLVGSGYSATSVAPSADREVDERRVGR